jgi:hypothetical protein
MTEWWNITPTGVPEPIASEICTPSAPGLRRSP